MPAPQQTDIEQPESAASISVNDAGDPSAPPLGPINPVQLTPNFYTESAIDSEYIIDSGLLQVPVAGPPGTPCEIIAVHAPIARRRARWTAERNGLPPLVPAASVNANEVLAESVIEPTTPAMSPEGIHVYRLSGRYEVFLYVPPGPQDPLSAGTTAYDTTPSSSNNVMASQFDASMLDTSSTVPAGFGGITGLS